MAPWLQTVIKQFGVNIVQAVPDAVKKLGEAYERLNEPKPDRSGMDELERKYLAELNVLERMEWDRLCRLDAFVAGPGAKELPAWAGVFNAKHLGMLDHSRLSRTREQEMIRMRKKLRRDL